MAITRSIDLASLDGSNGFIIHEAPQEYRFGDSVSSAGDVNGDGFDDFIVGAPGGLFGEPSSGYTPIPGSSYVVFGKASGFDAAMNLSDLDGSNGFHLDNAENDNFLGYSVSSAGDINGDGFDDVIVSALSLAESSYYYGPNPGAGSSYVVFGKASGFDATMNLSDLDGSNGFRLNREDENDGRGISVSNAGDINGDGIDDLIVGDSRADPNGLSSGSSYVVFGKTSGFDATMDLSSLDGANGFRLAGVAEYDRSGISVSSAGDVNGDGFDDVIVGAYHAGPNGLSSGSSYVVFGKTSGFDAAINLSDLNGSNGFRLDGAAAGDRSGRSVSSAGDVNGDGFDDVIVGASGADLNGYASGSSYVVFGKTSGFDAAMNLSDLDGSNGFRLDGAAAGDESGWSVSNAGDVNGDGFDDVIVGADRDPFGISSSYVVLGRASGFDRLLNPMVLSGALGFSGREVSGAGDVNGDGFDDLMIGAPGGLYEDSYNDTFVKVPGYTYIVFGSSDFTGNDVDFPGTSADDVFTGTSAAESFDGGDGNDRMIGRGGADEFYGEAGDDYIRVADLSFQWVDGGDGRDTLELGGGGLNLDLAGVNGRISDIETIYLYGTGDNTLTLTALDVVNLSSTSNTLRVDGNEGDRVVGLSSGWDDGGIHGKFHTYTQGEAVLLVGVNVATDFVDDNAISLFSLNGSNGFRLDGVKELDVSGASVSVAGDVNGDGFDDVIVGASRADPNGYASGSSYVVFGKASGFSATMDLSSLDGSNGFRLDGVTSYDYSGWSVSNAGDVNGDGFDDLIVGAFHTDPNGGDSGSSYVVFGKASGFSATLELSSLDGANGFRLDGEAGFDRSGFSVSNAGDVNGDGFDDVIVGAWGAGSSGSSYVVFGKASGFSAKMDLSSFDGSNGFRLDGEAGFDRSGFSVSNAGDVNGDGFDDVIVGADSDPFGISSSYVVFGKASGFSATMELSSLDGSNGFRLRVAGDNLGRSVSNAGDVNGDGFDDVIVRTTRITQYSYVSGPSYVVFGKASGFSATMELSSLDGSNGFRLDGETESNSIGTASNAGDVNGDGFDDLIVGASGNDSNGGDSGSSYVVFGKASGFSATMELFSLDGSSGFHLDGEAAGDRLGSSVSSAGDVNGDGFDDLIVGALGADPNGEFSGSSYIIFGRSDFGPDVDFPGTAGDDELIGTKAAERFDAGAGNDKMIGRGGADEFYGQAGDDYIRVSDLNFQWVDGGTGRDTLGLGGKGLNLDLSSVQGRISDIETIYLYGTGDNTLTLTALDVVYLSSTSNTLRVNGNEGDRIVGLGRGWDDGGVHGKFHTYTQGEAVLLVGVNVATDFPVI